MWLLLDDEGGPLGVDGVEGVDVKSKTDDTRSFIMSRPQLQMSPPTTEHLQAKEEAHSAVPRTVQSR